MGLAPTAMGIRALKLAVGVDGCAAGVAAGPQTCSRSSPNCPAHRKPLPSIGLLCPAPSPPGCRGTTLAMAGEVPSSRTAWQAVHAGLRSGGQPRYGLYLWLSAFLVVAFVANPPVTPAIRGDAGAAWPTPSLTAEDPLAAGQGHGEQGGGGGSLSFCCCRRSRSRSRR